MPSLTKDADDLLCLIYEEYLLRLDSGQTRTQARSFDHTPETISRCFPAVRLLDTLSELRGAGFIKKYLRDSFRLEPAGIVYMEERFPRGLSQVLEWSAKIAALFGLM